MKTTLNKEYALRFLGVTALFLALSGWFLYDGLIGYPQENEQVKPVATELALQGKTPEEWMNTAKTGTEPLVEAFRAKGLETPSKYTDTFKSWININDKRAKDIECAKRVLMEPVHSRDDIVAQFVSAGIGIAAAALLLVIVFVRKLTHYTLDERALIVGFGAKTTAYPLDTLRSIDASQWKSRGILRVTFEAGTVKLDAWHHTGVKDIAQKLFEVAGIDLEAQPQNA